jgi:SWI/SNF-related matrix-associated actin-dependent regulator of chromatin subfamily B member 1
MRRKGRGKRRVSILGKAGEGEGDADVDGEGDDDEKPCVLGVLEVHEKTEQEDMRILIKVGCFSTRFVSGRGLMVGLCKLYVIVGAMWDADNDGASPEWFAEVYARELGLAGEFK